MSCKQNWLYYLKSFFCICLFVDVEKQTLFGLVYRLPFKIVLTQCVYKNIFLYLTKMLKKYECEYFVIPILIRLSIYFDG